MTVDLVLLGDSLTEWGDWPALLARAPATLRNHGVAGDTVADVRARVAVALREAPRTIALLVGINDLVRGASAERAADAVIDLALEIRTASPGSRLVVQSLLPVGTLAFVGLLPRVEAVNVRVAAAAVETGCTFADVASALRGDDGALRATLTTDGLHLTPAGYAVWARALSSWL